MNKINVSLLLISCIFCVVNGFQTNSAPIGRKQVKSYCIAQISTPEEKLQEFIDYACGVIDCSAIQPGGSCYYPIIIISHADYALNQIYRYKGSCDLSIAMIINIDPSYGSCKYS
ncbi:hypothetical protein ABFS82_07G061400 [Erythranthe guttata]